MPSEVRSGCAAVSHAVAHDADGQRLDPPPTRGYHAWSQRTGTPSGASPMVVATGRGTLLFLPAVATPTPACDLARSTDGGSSWMALRTAPRVGGHFEAGREAATTFHPWLCCDRITGRLFASVAVNGGSPDTSSSIVAISDDDGDSWRAAAVGGSALSWGKLYLGPPATEHSRRALERNGYPNVVYFSASGPGLVAGPNQRNFKSTDGGVTWTRVSDTFSTAQAKALACGFPQRGVVAPYGGIYRAWAGTPAQNQAVAGARDISVHVVRSLDEGESWDHFELPHARTCMLGATLAVDREQTLYLAWPDSQDGQIRLSVSRDRAQTWSTPRKVVLPGVAWTARPTIEVRGPGEIALACWGSAQAEGQGDGWFDRDGRPYNGYLCICQDVHNDQAVFWTAVINDPARPLLPKGQSALTSGAYLGPPSFAPDGSVWGGFVDLAEAPMGVAAYLRPAPKL